jgi:hypothetical protein
MSLSLGPEYGWRLDIDLRVAVPYTPWSESVDVAEVESVR